MADEANLVAIGMFKQTRILFGVRGVRGERDRIVSARARAATSAEELFYEQGS